ncbi:unnamed protein product [Didymodactylos carnosus]|nr:unnamed protein product [Didymodactylos carnosus]CAF3829044.1 unnamed protein product [Didymodactylos carnosus]
MYQRSVQAWKKLKVIRTEIKFKFKSSQEKMNEWSQDVEKSNEVYQIKLEQTKAQNPSLANAIDTLIENHRYVIEKIRKQLRNKKHEEKHRMENVQDISAQIEKLYNQLRTVNQNSNDNQSLDVRVEWNRLEKQRNRLIQESHVLRLRDEQINDDLRKLHAQPAHKQCELESIQNMRLQSLQLSDPDSYKAVIWYRNNKNLFRKRVYVPMILSLNIEDQDMAKYVEFIIPKRDLTAMFIFEDTDDMKLFINECHTKQDLVVYVSTIPQLTLQDFKTQVQPIA